jgi:uncharacterized membrane protein YdjX (TVP38/TMEM64 family)
MSSSPFKAPGSDLGSPAEPSAPEVRSHKRLRVALLLGLLVLAPIVMRATGLTSQLSVSHFRALVAQAGTWGSLAFVLVFVGAVVLQVPGFAFVIVAPTLFQLPEAWLLCFIASNLAVVLNFAVVRKFGGQPFKNLESPRLRRLFGQLDRHPVRTVALLRTLTVMFPPVTGALALTRLSARDHAVGSALGMLLPVTAILLVAAAIVQVVP